MKYSILMRLISKIAILRILLFIILNLKVFKTQSTCNFMQQFEYFDLKGMPTEPFIRNFTSICKSFQQNNNDLSERTCCTLGIEADMQRIVRSNFEVQINNQLNLLKQFFLNFSQNIKGINLKYFFSSVAYYICFI